MRAIDTNVLARFVLNDDATQSPIAIDIIASGVLVTLTVLLETFWLLTSRYRQTKQAALATLRMIAELPSVTIADEDHVFWALERSENGADLVDMIHLVAATGADAFVTFDQAIAPGAGANPLLPVETLA